MILPAVPPEVDLRKMPWAAVPGAPPAFRSMLSAAASASAFASVVLGLICEILSVPWPVSWPPISAALKAVFAEMTFKAALFVPPFFARFSIATWSPGVMDVDLALIATPEVTLTAMGLLSAVVASGGMVVPSGAAVALVADAMLGASSPH